MTISEIQDEIIEEFSLFEDWMDKYEHIIDFGKELPALPAEYKTEEHIVKGCQSQVWLKASLEEDNLTFEADSDAIITKGLVGLLVRVLSGHKPEEISQSDLYFIKKIGLHEHLSPNRSNGLAAMIKQMKFYAIAYASKS